MLCFVPYHDASDYQLIVHKITKNLYKINQFNHVGSCQPITTIIRKDLPIIFKPKTKLQEGLSRFF